MQNIMDIRTGPPPRGPSANWMVRLSLFGFVKFKSYVNLCKVSRHECLLCADVPNDGQKQQLVFVSQLP
jgi:hypothetical protein